MSKNVNRSTGMTPLEAFRRDIAGLESPWRTDEKIGKKFDATAKTIHVLLEQGEQGVKLKQLGNKAFAEKRYDDALKAWAEAREVWQKADVRGHHLAVLWNNEAWCRSQYMGDLDGARNACNEGLSHFTTPEI